MQDEARKRSFVVPTNSDRFPEAHNALQELGEARSFDFPTGAFAIRTRWDLDKVCMAVKAAVGEEDWVVAIEGCDVSFRASGQPATAAHLFMHQWT